jgi:hypothetical protein
VRASAVLYPRSKVRSVEEQPPTDALMRKLLALD